MEIRSDNVVEKINYDDNLKEGTDKLNQSIDQSNTAAQKAVIAENKANESLQQSESTQTQLDNIVIEGDSSVEAAQARVDSKGESFPTLKARIDNFELSANQQLQEMITNVKQFGAIGDGANDDTEAIQEAYDHVYGKGGGVLYFPLGEYKTTKPIIAGSVAQTGNYSSPPVIFKGEGNTASKIIKEGTEKLYDIDATIIMKRGGSDDLSLSFSAIQYENINITNNSPGALTYGVYGER